MCQFRLTQLVFAILVPQYLVQNTFFWGVKEVSFRDARSIIQLGLNIFIYRVLHSLPHRQWFLLLLLFQFPNSNYLLFSKRLLDFNYLRQERFILSPALFQFTSPLCQLLLLVPYTEFFQGISVLLILLKFKQEDFFFPDFIPYESGVVFCLLDALENVVVDVLLWHV